MTMLELNPLQTQHSAKGYSNVLVGILLLIESLLIFGLENFWLQMLKKRRRKAHCLGSSSDAHLQLLLR